MGMAQAACTHQTFLSKTFANSLNMQKQFEKNAWEKGNDAYSLIDKSTYHEKNIFAFRFIFHHNINVKENVFFSELEKALRDTLTRAAWHGLLFTTAN